MSIGNVGAGNLYVRRVGVVAEDTLLLKTDAGKTPTDWSPSGYLAYTSRATNVWALSLPLSGDSKPIQRHEHELPREQCENLAEWPLDRLPIQRVRV